MKLKLKMFTKILAARKKGLIPVINYNNDADFSKYL